MCSNCQVPHDSTDKIARKMQVSKEVWAKVLGTIYTREKFLDHRLELAHHEWARFKSNDSLECRNCATYDYMDFTRQRPRGGHAREVPGSGEWTCIDRHKNGLPDMGPNAVPGRSWGRAVWPEPARALIASPSPVLRPRPRHQLQSQRLEPNRHESSNGVEPHFKLLRL